MRKLFVKIFCLLLVMMVLQSKAQNILEVYRMRKSSNENLRESYFLTTNKDAKIVTEQFTYRGTIQQIADTFLVIDSQKVAYRLIQSIAFKKSDAAYSKQKWTGAALTLPALAFAGLFTYSIANNDKSSVQSCFGGVGSLIFVPVALIWGIPKLFGNLSTFDLYNNKWQMSFVKKP